MSRSCSKPGCCSAHPEGGSPPIWPTGTWESRNRASPRSSEPSPMRISDFDYVLPEEAIAQTPTEPRDASRLLVATTLTDHRFSDLPSLLDPGDLLVVNDTRVRAARLHGHKQGTGGAVELLLLERRGERWTAMVRPARRLRAGSVVEAGPIRAQLESDPKDGIVTVTLDAPGDIEAAV